MGQMVLERQRREQARMTEFEQLCRLRRRTDEVTEASEKLAAPMHNIFDYTLHEDGELYFQGQSVREVFDTGIAVAEELVRTQPQFSVELLRRYVERDEYEAMCLLAQGEDGAPDVLVVLSPIPDAVLAGVELNAYDIERRKTMARIFERTDEGVRATSVSLDRSDRQALHAIANQFGEVIEDDDSSEEILSKRLWGWRRDFADQPVSRRVRQQYDEVLSQKYGGRWYGGRQDAAELDALDFIMQQQDLIAAHERALDEIELHGGDIERARYDFTAALSRRLRGETDAGSLHDAGREAAARGEVYRSDCPTGTTSATQSAEALGFQNRQWRKGTCRVCLKGGTVGECDVCPGCEAADNRGENLTEISRRAQQAAKVRQALARRAASEAVEPSQASKKDKVIERYGKYAMRGELRLVTGGKAYDVLDSRTGALIGTISA